MELFWTITGIFLHFGPNLATFVSEYEISAQNTSLKILLKLSDKSSQRFSRDKEIILEKSRKF